MVLLMNEKGNDEAVVMMTSHVFSWKRHRPKHYVLNFVLKQYADGRLSFIAAIQPEASWYVDGQLFSFLKISFCLR